MRMRAPIGFKLSVIFSIVLLGVLLTADSSASPTSIGLCAQVEETAENISDPEYTAKHRCQVHSMAGIEALLMSSSGLIS